MKKLIFIYILFIFSMNVTAQKNDIILDLKKFNTNTEIAEWLYMYDAVAWWTSDSVMTNDKSEIERLGNEWFCYISEDNLWNAVYGKYENNNFDMVFHYVVGEDGIIRRVFDNVDTTMSNSFSRALILAKETAAPSLDTMPVTFNQYIRRNDDKTITVWLLPAITSKNAAVYGAEFIYTFNKYGNKMLKDESYIQGPLRGFLIGEPREIWVEYPELEQPSLGGIFFVWYFKKYFTQIKLETKYYISTVFKNDDSGYYWVHVQKENESKSKNNKKK